MGFERRYRTVSDVLNNTVQTANDCMEWQGATDRDGYAACNAYGLFKSQALHREVHRLCTGESPEVVMHTCDNRKCINPQHLVAGTHVTNLLDKLTKNRQAKGETNGNAKLTEGQVSLIREMRKKHRCTYAEIGSKFNISKATVWRVLSGANWGHVCK